VSYHRELWERSNLPTIKGGDRHRKKRITKGQLVAKSKRKEGNGMPKIETEVRDGADDVQIGVSYEITNVEDIVTDVQQFSGLRVVLVSPEGDEGTVVLWKRKVTGKGSKLGVFIEALGNNTDSWLHKWIVFRNWLPRDRKIEVLESHKAKAAKPAKKGK
jgi:hypothetical protein